MSEKYEVEYRAIIPKSTFSSLLKKGQKEHADNFNGPTIIQDSYFCRKNIKSFKEIEMDIVGSYSLRLRQEINSDDTKISLNTKTIKNAGDHNAWAEHEVFISSYPECDKIIKTIGFKVFFEFTKKRYSFTDKDITVFLEDIKNFGQVIEIEILTTKRYVDKSKEKILAYLEKNGITKNMIVEKSITNLLMKKLSKF